MRFSVIVPIYNCAEAAEATLQSIRGSTFKDYELIAVDDCSTEGTAAALKHADTLLKLPVHRGPAYARNFAARKAAGEYIVWSDSDVVWPPELLGRFHEAIEANPGCGGVATWADGQPLNRGFWAEYHARAEQCMIENYLRGRNLSEYEYVTTRCGAIRRDLFLETGGFDERFLVPSIEDFEFSSRFMRTARFLFIRNSGLRHRWSSSFPGVAKRLFRNSHLWTKTMFRGGRFQNALTTRERGASNLSGALSFIAIPLVVIDMRLLALPVVLSALCFLLNLRIIAFMNRAGGASFALRAALALQVLSIPILAGAVSGFLSRNRSGRWHTYENPAIT